MPAADSVGPLYLPSFYALHMARPTKLGMCRRSLQYTGRDGVSYPLCALVRQFAMKFCSCRRRDCARGEADAPSHEPARTPMPFMLVVAFLRDDEPSRCSLPG